MIPPQAAIALFVRCVVNAASTFLRPAVFLPFALLSLLQLAPLLVYLHFTHPSLAGGAAPLVGAAFGEGVLHYPMHIWYLPAAIDWIRCVVSVMPGTALIAWAATAPTFTARDEEKRSQHLSERLAPLFVVNAGFALALVGLQRGVGYLADVSVVGRLQPVWIALAVAARPLLFFVFADVVFRVLDDDRGGFAAVFAAPGPIVVPLLLSATGAVALAPVRAAVLSAKWFVDTGMPDVVASIATFSVVWDAPVLAFLLSAAAAWRDQREALR